MLRTEGYARRSEVALRTVYPHLETRIFEIAPARYRIVFAKDALDATGAANYFANNIRFIGAMVDISNDVPEHFIRELNPITDHHLSRSFEGVPFTTVDILNLAGGRFPELDLVTLRGPDDGIVQFVVHTEPSAELKSQVEAWWDEMATGTTACVVFDPEARTAHSVVPTDPFTVIPARLRPRAPRWTKDDDAFWFTNLDRLYAGQIEPGSIAHVRDDEFSCYLDFSTGATQMNLRQALVMYETVFVTPPLTGEQSGWQAQHVSDKDILSLVETGRLKFVLTQPEERCDIPTLEAAYERNQNAIIPRRTMAAIVLADLVCTAQKYRLNQTPFRRGVANACEFLANSLNAPAGELMQFLMWPTIALRKSLVPLNRAGPFGTINLGLGDTFAAPLKRLTGRDLQLECMMIGFPVHLAHALNVTFIPSRSQPASWTSLAREMGTRLNFYRSFDDSIAAAWVGNELRKEAHQQVLPDIPLFEFDPTVPVSDILDVSRYHSIRKKGRFLICRLSSLSPDDQKAEVMRLTRELRKLRAHDAGFFSVETLDAGLSLVEPLTPVTGLSLPITIWKLLRRIAEPARRIHMLDALIDALDSDLAGTLRHDRDLDFLSRVDRVGMVLAHDRIV